MRALWRMNCSGLMLICLCAGAWAEGNLRERMSADDFKRAGLEKLTPEELTYLERWLTNKQSRAVTDVAPVSPGAARPTATEPASAPPAAPPEQRFGLEQVEKAPEPDIPEQITARLKGQFRGWTGDTVFRLDNGQVWQQRVGGKYRSKKLTDPEVIVQRGRWGYYLKVVGVKRTIGVRRLQ